MTGCQKATLLVLMCTIVVVFALLVLLVQGRISLPARGTPTAHNLDTPSSTPRGIPSEMTTPTLSATSTPTQTAEPSSTATHTPLPCPTPTETVPARPSPTETIVLQPTPSSTAPSDVPADVISYLGQFVPLVLRVHDMNLLAGRAAIDESTVDQLRELYGLLHAIDVPEGAEEMHLAFIIYVSVLEEKSLCHIFAEAHSGDSQGEHYRQCENDAASAAIDVMSNRFIPSRDGFVEQYGLTAAELGFPY